MQRRTIWSFSLFVAVYIVSFIIAGLGSIHATQMRKDNTRSHQELVYTSYAVADMEGAESSAKGFLLSGDLRDLSGLETVKQKLTEDLANLKALTRGDPEQSRRVAELTPLLNQEMSDLALITELKKSESPHVLKELVRHSKLPSITRTRELFSQIIATENDTINARLRRMDNQAKAKLPVIFGSGFLGLFLLAFALNLLRRELKNRNQTTTELGNSEDRLRRTLNAGQMAIFEMNILTGDGDWIGAAQQIFGVGSVDEISNRTKAWQFIHPDDRDWVHERFEAAIHTGEYHEVECRLQRKNGEIRWIHGWAKIVNAVGVLPYRITGGVMDITDKKNARETIARQEKSILYSSKMAALGEMAGGIAHEINNPLAVISGQAQLCLEQMEAGEASDQQIMKSLQKIRQWVARTAKIIQGLRQFSRDATHDPFQVSRLSDIFDKTFELCQETFTRHNVRLDIELPPGDLQIECRPVQISQILLNLLQNGMHAVETRHDRWVKVKVESNADEVIFRVSDSGPGIPFAIRDKIMQPFFTTKETGKGTGLGLSISKGLVEGHRGQIYLDPEAKHTTFVVRLPIYLNLHGNDDQSDKPMGVIGRRAETISEGPSISS